MKQCKHPCCGDVCRKPAKAKKIYHLRRTPIKRKPYRIPKKSAKRLADDEKYFPLREKFLKAHPICQCGRNGCKRKATDIHHKKGRGIYYLVVKTWMAVARSCHRWINDNPEEAMALGLTETRLD